MLGAVILNNVVTVNKLCLASLTNLLKVTHPESGEGKTKNPVAS